MNYNDEDNEAVSSSNNDYHLKGLDKFGRYPFAGFLVWCTFHYPMSETMQFWFYVWAVFAWLLA